jgi:hypothetical protein
MLYEQNINIQEQSGMINYVTPRMRENRGKTAVPFNRVCFIKTPYVKISTSIELVPKTEVLEQPHFLKFMPLQGDLSCPI